MLERLEKDFRAVLPDVAFCSLRFVAETQDHLEVTRSVAAPPRRREDIGVMVTVLDRGGLGYAATADLGRSGLEAALRRATRWAHETAALALFDTAGLTLPEPVGEYETPVEVPWEATTSGEKLALLTDQCERLRIDARIVDRSASLARASVETLYLTSGGGRVHQQLHVLSPDMQVAASDGTHTQRRSLGARGETQQGGLEVLARTGFETRAAGLAEQALELLAAPECPGGRMALVLAPDQMILQVHESIGHPLELDRILGDERNYAGTSFVTPDMFGRYRYGSELLNVTFDPSIAHELASYRYDDDGVPAARTDLIRDGVLLRPLGSVVSQRRAGLPGVANARASSWNRPPIDRMANLNLEAGDCSFEALIGGVERGVFMTTNQSWSIDDSRNKFQFGCELGRLIEDGELTTVVKNPGYRGVSATFWRNLTGVGDARTVEVLGTPYCGKGEPNQVIRVGHAVPACRFADVDVFGGG